MVISLLNGKVKSMSPRCRQNPTMESSLPADDRAGGFGRISPTIDHGGPRACNGWSLPELLVALAVVGVLGALLLSALQAAIASSRRAAGTHDLRQIGIAMTAWASDHKGEFPYWPASPTNLAQRVNSSGNGIALPSMLIPDYIPEPGIFIAPADQLRRKLRDPATGWGREPGSSSPKHSYYFYYMNPAPSTTNSERAKPMAQGGYGEIWTTRNPGNRVLVNSIYFDTLHPVYRDGAMVLRINGSVQWYPNGTFRRERSIIGQFDQRD